jgi:cation:H+ antiporter
MHIVKDILIFLIGILVILKSADFFTDGAEGIAKAFKIPRIIIGLTIVSLATTAPELTVSVISSYMRVGGMAVGNALGSCLANIGLILAIAAMIRPLKFNPRILKQELPFLIFVASFSYMIMLDGHLSRIDGIFFCFLLLAFFWFIILRERKAKKELLEQPQASYNIKNDSIKFLLGASGVILSAKFAIIPSGINISRFLGVPEVVIGLSMVAVGTSLPELFTAIIASTKRMGELAIGNIIGANILNILLVLGVSSWVRPLDIDSQTISLTIPIMLLITLLMFLFSRTKLELTRREGLGLFAIYAGYIFYIFRFAYN